MKYSQIAMGLLFCEGMLILLEMTYCIDLERMCWRRLVGHSIVVTKSSEASSRIHLCKFAEAFVVVPFIDESKLRVHDHIQSAQLNVYAFLCQNTGIY